MSRPETGAMRFEGDWRGVFIRGDNATAYAMYLKTFATMPQYQTMLDGLIRLLESSDERREGVSTQEMKPYKECERKDLK